MKRPLKIHEYQFEAVSTHVETAPTGDPKPASAGDVGFTLIEAVVALLIILIALLGVVFTFSYAINYNAGNSSRAKTLAVLQQEVERIRSAKFTPLQTDALLLAGQTSRTVTVDNIGFEVTTDIDNDPSTPAIDGNELTTRLKAITITATLARPSPGWQTAVPAIAVLRRVRSN